MYEQDKHRLMKSRTSTKKGGLRINSEKAEGSVSLVGFESRAREEANNTLHLDWRVRPGLFLGQVKFVDPMGGGRVKVWIPEFVTTDTEYDVADENDARLITCIPLLPFGGVSTTGKGYGGRGNSYGFWSRPQEENWVGVLFPDMNIGMGVYIGALPSLTGNTGFPTNPGVKHDGSGGSDCPLPASEEPLFEPGTASSDNDLARNIVGSGLIHDPIRGPSQSGADKITSSVIGFKSPGDPGRGKLGHTIYMDDDGAYQGIRLRTSDGIQIAMSDSAEAIYLATQKSKAWIELTGDGHAFLHGTKSLSFHAEEDIRFQADRDFIVEVGRDFITKIVEDQRTEVGKTSSVWVKDEVQHKYDKSLKTLIGEDEHRKVGKGSKLKVEEDIKVETGAAHHTKAVGVIKRQTDATIRDQGGADSASPEEAAPEELKIESLPGPPTEEQQKEGKQGDAKEYVVGRDKNGYVPQREPWRPKTQQASTAPPASSMSNDDVPYKEIVNDRDGPLNDRNDRSVRNNNPGNIKGDPRSPVYAGEMPENEASVKQGGEFTGTNPDTGNPVTEGKHRVFRNPEYGFAAQTQLLQGGGYRGNPQTQTVRRALNRWVTGNPDTEAPNGYVDGVAADMGVDPDAPVAWDDSDFMFKMQKGMAKRESDGFQTGQFTDGQLSRGMAMAGMQPGATKYDPASGTLPAPAKPAKAPAIPSNNEAGTPKKDDKDKPVRAPELPSSCDFPKPYIQTPGGASGDTQGGAPGQGTGGPGTRTGFRSQKNIEYIFVHCTWTPPEMDIGVSEISVWHQARGWRTCGYHKVIRRSGSVETGRPDDVVGAHVGDSFPNAGSLAVSLVGGKRSASGGNWPNYEGAQMSALQQVIQEWKAKWPKAVVLGHYNVSRVKSCPNFDARTWNKTGQIIPVLRRESPPRGYTGDVLIDPQTIQEGQLPFI